MTFTQLKKFLLRIIATDGYVLARNGDDLEGKAVGAETIKGWVNFMGSGTVTINDSFNVSGIVDLGPGNYRIAWDTNFASANYAAAGNVSCIGCSDWNVSFNNMLTGTIDMLVYDVSVPGFFDPGKAFCMAIGDQ